MSFVITSNGYAPGYVLSRTYIGKYKARDFISPVMRVFGGRLVPGQALVFGTKESAREYLNRHEGLIPDTWKIVRYDPCMNALRNEVY